MKKRAWWAAAVLIVLLAAACGRTSQATPKQTMQVHLSDMKVAITGTAKEDSRISLDVQNDGPSPHSLAVEAAGRTFETKVLDRGQATALELPELVEGSYTTYCTIPGHREAGMESTLTVALAASAKEEAPAEGTAMSPAEMDRMHEAGVKAFPARTRALGGRILEPRLQGSAKVFELTSAPVKWEVSPNQFVNAFAYNGQIPGPELHVKPGDRIKVILHNQMDQSTAIHFHGVDVPNGMDGVPFITQPPVRKGESYTYEFTIKDVPGTYMYHSHHNATEQVGKGLLGAFVIDPPTKPADVEATIVLGDGPLGYTLNGKGFPATQPVTANLGETVYVRFINAGQLSHPMHLHGVHFDVVARDGRPIAPYTIDTLSIGPGEIYDAVLTASSPGVWAFHCHILSHAESEHGMHGMVTALIVSDPKNPA
jgi:manganese oxidase